MKAIIGSLHILFMQIVRDRLIALICIVPLGVAMLFYFCAPMANDLLTSEYGFKDLPHYYRLFDLLLTILTPYLFGFASAMIILGEMDEHIIPSYFASPLSKKGYLLSRIFFPTMLSAAFTLVIINVFHLSNSDVCLLATLSIWAAFVCLIPMMLVVTFAKNKVEGMAFTKISGLLLLGLFIPFFVTSHIQYVFSFMPSFWLAKLAITSNYLYLLPTLVSSLIWLGLLYTKFKKKF